MSEEAREALECVAVAAAIVGGGLLLFGLTALAGGIWWEIAR